jgi:hypothetical protein
VDSVDQLLSLLFDVMYAAVSLNSILNHMFLTHFNLTLERVAFGSIASNLLFDCRQIRYNQQHLGCLHGSGDPTLPTADR